MTVARFVGVSTGPATTATEAVNSAMIRHWVEAMGDEHPAYLATGIAPPTMLQAWTMKGLRAGGAPRGDSALDELMGMLDDEGLTSVVATDCRQTYERDVKVGDLVTSETVIESISEEKKTGLGVGRFVTTETSFSVGEEQIGTMLFRILKFRPAEKVPEKPLRPRPSVTEDLAFWFEAAREHRLLIQRCEGCGALQHPPLPSCPSCRSFEMGSIEASGRGEIFSFVVVHYPQVPSFDYPLPIALVELEEGTRLVANLVGDGPFAIGDRVEVEWIDHDEELALPAFSKVR